MSGLRRWGGGGRALCLALVSFLGLAASTGGRAAETPGRQLLESAPLVVDTSPCVTFQADDYAPLTDSSGAVLGFATVRSGTANGPRPADGAAVMRLDILLSHQQPWYFAQPAPTNTSGGSGVDTSGVNVVVGLSSRQPDACPATVQTDLFGQALDCNARNATLLVPVPTQLFRCMSNDTDDAWLSFFVALRLQLSKEACGAPSVSATAGSSVNTVAPGCSYILVTGKCQPATCGVLDDKALAALSLQAAAAPAPVVAAPLVPAGQQDTLAHQAIAIGSGAAGGLVLAAIVVAGILYLGSRHWRRRRRRYEQMKAELRAERSQAFRSGAQRRGRRGRSASVDGAYAAYEAERAVAAMPVSPYTLPHRFASVGGAPHGVFAMPGVRRRAASNEGEMLDVYDVSAHGGSGGEDNNDDSADSTVGDSFTAARRGRAYFGARARAAAAASQLQPAGARGPPRGRLWPTVSRRMGDAVAAAAAVEEELLPEEPTVWARQRPKSKRISLKNMLAAANSGRLTAQRSLKGMFRRTTASGAAPEGHGDDAGGGADRGHALLAHEGGAAQPPLPGGGAHQHDLQLSARMSDDSDRHSPGDASALSAAHASPTGCLPCFAHPKRPPLRVSWGTYLPAGTPRPPPQPTPRARPAGQPGSGAMPAQGPYQGPPPAPEVGSTPAPKRHSRAVRFSTAAAPPLELAPEVAVIMHHPQQQQPWRRPGASWAWHMSARTVGQPDPQLAELPVEAQGELYDPDQNPGGGIVDESSVGLTLDEGAPSHDWLRHRASSGIL